MKKLLLSLLLITFIFPKKSISQNNDNAALFGALAGAAAVAAAVEAKKEVLEAYASNIILSELPHYKEFRLKLIGWGDGGKRLSDNGQSMLFPFALTELENTLETDNRKLLLLFATPGWVNEYGLDMTKISWELWSASKWNRLLSVFSELNSPTNIPIVSNLIPKYKKSNIGIKPSRFKNMKKKKDEIYIMNKTDNLGYIYAKDLEEPSINISELQFTKEGWKYKRKIIYPFYSLDGDDYLVSEFSETLRVFSNEKALGVFLKNEKNQMLMQYQIVNKIHTFINSLPE